MARDVTLKSTRFLVCCTHESVRGLPGSLSLLEIGMMASVLHAELVDGVTKTGRRLNPIARHGELGRSSRTGERFKLECCLV